MQSGSINVILFGETGVGKSSIVNLIVREKLAEVSQDVDGCTMESTPYKISFDGMDFTIFDTVGLEEPKVGVNGYLEAIEKALGLIRKLEASGGIHLLLFCIRGRITTTTQSNYRLFWEIFCREKVPIALVFTEMEREADPERWWKEQQPSIERRYEMKSLGHACVTAVDNPSPRELDIYNKSQEKIRDLLKDCALKSGARPSLFDWFAKGFMRFFKKDSDPGRKKLMKTMTERCNLAPSVAEKIVDMMEKSDT